MPLGIEGEIPLHETNLAGLLDVGGCKQTSQNYIKMSFLQDIIVSNDGKNYTLVVSWGFPLKSVGKTGKISDFRPGASRVRCQVHLSSVGSTRFLEVLLSKMLVFLKRTVGNTKIYSIQNIWAALVKYSRGCLGPGSFILWMYMWLKVQYRSAIQRFIGHA